MAVLQLLRSYFHKLIRIPADWSQSNCGEKSRGKQKSFDFIIMTQDRTLSSLQNLYAPDPDPELEIVHYPRTKEQEDDLGISDMKTEGYEEDNQS